jgi:uncharacterized membrane protein YcaP (DUF421 family)
LQRCSPFLLTTRPQIVKLDWNEIFIGDLDFTFALEIALRSLIMFVMVLLILRLSGKKGVRQLSLFEVAIIISLGSAAGDPMFNKDAAILPALMVFGTILLFYRLITYFASKSERFEKLLEGESMLIVEDGRFVVMDENDHTFAKDEFFAEMRQQSIEHVGQVRIAILESNGTVSFYYYDDEEVVYGLPIIPGVYSRKSKNITATGHYACTYCAQTEELKPGVHNCKRCQKNEWVAAINTTRLS